MEYYLFEDGQIVTRTAALRVTGIVPVSAGDRDMAPSFPGISDSPTLESWDPPFPVDLRRIRPQDEAVLGALPFNAKGLCEPAGRPAVMAIAIWRVDVGSGESSGQRVDRSLRADFEPRLRAAIDPLALGLTVSNVRARSLEASRGVTDFAIIRLLQLLLVVLAPRSRRSF